LGAYSFLQSKGISRLSSNFGAPHAPIDYFETTEIQLYGSTKPKTISAREFHVATLEEKAQYPSAFIVLMRKVNEIEEETQQKGKPADVPDGCRVGLAGKTR
jgi:hypothetical protein